MSAGQRNLGSALIVEDDAVLALSLEEALHVAGVLSVWCCGSIGEAMSCLAREQPAILVLDVKLADRNDGWALAELACQVCVPPPLIVFSTGVPEAVPPAIAALGHVLAKPYDPSELTLLVGGGEGSVARGGQGAGESVGVLARIRRMLG